MGLNRLGLFRESESRNAHSGRAHSRLVLIPRRPYFNASAKSLSVTFPERRSQSRMANGFGMLRPDS